MSCPLKYHSTDGFGCPKTGHVNRNRSPSGSIRLELKGSLDDNLKRRVSEVPV
jgi:hypothetical protein